MSGFWLGSYLVLWGVVIVLAFLMLGCLQQIGLLKHPPAERPTKLEESLPEVKDDGPPIGSPLPTLPTETINGLKMDSVIPTESQNRTLLIFMAPLCESCQHLVEPLNAFVEDREHPECVIVILRADEEGCQAFLSVFPLRVPVVCDTSRTITKGFNVHASPFGLLYDASGALVRKGTVVREEDLRALLGDGTVSRSARLHVFPPPESLDISAVTKV